VFSRFAAAVAARTDAALSTYDLKGAGNAPVNITCCLPFKLSGSSLFFDRQTGAVAPDGRAELMSITSELRSQC